MTEYLIVFKTRAGDRDPEAQSRPSLQSAATCVEEWAEYDCELDYALEIEAVLGQRTAHDRTEQVNDILSERETERAREAYANPTWGDRADFQRALEKAE